MPHLPSDLGLSKLGVMSSSRVLARSASAALRLDVCAFCRVRPSLPIVGRYNAAAASQPVVSRVHRRSYAQRLDVKSLRADVDKRGRIGWYHLTSGQKILLLQPDVAEAIYSDFVAHKNGKDDGKLVKHLVSSTALNSNLKIYDSLLTVCRIQHHPRIHRRASNDDLLHPRHHRPSQKSPTPT